MGELILHDEGQWRSKSTVFLEILIRQPGSRNGIGTTHDNEFRDLLRFATQMDCVYPVRRLMAWRRKNRGDNSLRVITDETCAERAGS